MKNREGFRILNGELSWLLKALKKCRVSVFKYYSFQDVLKVVMVGVQRKKD